MITAEQKQLRRSYIGSSDASAILGLDPFKSAADVFLEKTGQLNEWQGNENTDRGTLLEPVILDWAQEQLGYFAREQMRVHENGILATNFDGIDATPLAAHSQPFIVEAKSSVVPEEWGTEGTDEIPDRVVVQVHHAMYVAGPEFRVAYVPVLLPGYRSFDFRLYRVERRDELADAIASQCVDFVESFIRPLIRPSEFRPSLDVLKRVKREPNKIVPVADELVDAWIATKAAAKQAEKDAEEAQAALLAAMGDAEAATFGRGELTYFETHRKGYTAQPSTFRQLRLKAAKK